MCTWFHFCCGMKQLGRCSQVLDRVFGSGKHCNSSNLEACKAYRVRCNVDWVCIIYCCPCYSDVVPTCITGGRILLVVYQGTPTNHGTHPPLENMIIGSPLPDACWWTYHVVGCKFRGGFLWQFTSVPVPFKISFLLEPFYLGFQVGSCQVVAADVVIAEFGLQHEGHLWSWDKGNILMDIFKEMFVKSALFPWWSSW